MEVFLQENSELNRFVLSDVKLTGTTIGRGSYGSVEEVAIPGAVCAAKTIHGSFLDPSIVRPVDIKKASTQFVKECQLMSTLRHPNIVQFLGICEVSGSRLPALVMERLMTCLHDVLDPEIDPPPPAEKPKPFLPLYLKCSILHDVASGLAYLHGQSQPIIHRDLSARNVLLNSGMVAKIADLGMARITFHIKSASTMTKAPGASVYMPPEALENHPGEKKLSAKDSEEGAKYDTSIDVFSFGVVSLFTLSQTFPCDLLAPNYRKGIQHIARTELERRDEYIQIVYGELGKTHPLSKMIERCFDFPENRPTIHGILGLLQQVRAENGDAESKTNLLQLIRALDVKQRLEHTLQCQLAELEEKLQSNEEGKHLLTEQLTAAEETMKETQEDKKKGETAHFKKQLPEKISPKQTEEVEMHQLKTNKELKRLRAEKECMECQLAKIMAHSKAQSQRVQNLQHSLQEKEHAMESSKNENRCNKTVIKEHQAMIRSQHKDLVSLQNQKKELARDLAAAKATAEIYREDFERERSDRARAAGKIESLETTVKEKAQALAQKTNELSGIEEAVKKQLDEVDEDQKLKAAQIEDYKKQIESLQVELKKTQQTVVLMEKKDD